MGSFQKGVQEYLDMLPEHKNVEQAPRAPSKTFAIAEPHTCKHCQMNVIDGETLKSDGIFHLSYNVEPAVLAAKSGCAFYEWMLDFWAQYCLKFDIQEYAVVNFSLAFRPPLQPTAANIIIEAVYPDGRREGQLCWPDPQLVVCTTEGWLPENKAISMGLKVNNLFPGNKAAEYVPIRPNELDPMSRATRQFASNCLQSCMASHNECRRGLTTCKEGQLTTELIAASDLPSRLLQISEGNNQIKLIQLSDLNPGQQEGISAVGFAALSYCWGGDQPVKLTKNSFTILKDGIATSKLPKTLQDAMWVTASIGLKYIWIDSLCIVQDDDTDKELEIARMSSYYGATTVTICTASASTCEEGFLGTRSDIHYDAGPFQLPFETRDGTGSILLYREAKPLEPTTKRAWTLQETLLSRRVLVFSSKQLYWCCATANAGCGGPCPELRNRILGDPESLVPSIYPLKVLEKYPADLQWLRVTEDFMKRSLGFAEDKLLAISATASTLHPMFSERQGHVVYLAGLFISLADPVRTSEQLLWYIKVPQSRRIKRYRAPSWSWACLDGTLNHLAYKSYFPRGSTLDEYHVRSRILDYGIDLSTPSALYGAIRGGFLLFHGSLRIPDASVAVPRRVIIDPETPAFRVHDFEGTTETYLGLFPDTADDQSLIETGLDSESQIFCLELLPYTSKRASPIGLVLARCTDMNIETYKRVGIFIFCRSKEGKHEPDLWRAARESFFSGVALRDVRVV